MRQSPSSRRFTFISLLVFALLILAGCAAQIFAQTNDGKLMIQQFNDDGPATLHFVAPENNKAIGINGSGIPAMLAVGGSSTLAGLSDVAISGLANLDVLRYNSATSKWQNIPGSTFALASSLSDYITSATAASTYAPLAHNQAWSTITSTPTTLAGYGISDAITAAAATDAFQPLDDDLTSIAGLATTSTGRSLLAAADAAALRSILAVSDVGVHTFGGQRQILTSPASSGTSATSSSISAVLDFLTGSGLAAPQGSIIYKGATGWGLRSIGTNGQVLSSNGTQPVWSDPASAGIGGTVGTTDNAIVRADGTGGSTAQGSVATITDAGGISAADVTTTGRFLGASEPGYPQFTETGHLGNGMRVYSSQLDFWIGGAVQFVVYNQLVDFSASGMAWGTNARLFGGSDGTGRLVQRVGATPQAFSVAKTYTSYTNKEEVELGWTGDVAHLWTVKGSGGGTARPLVLGTDETERVRIAINGEIFLNLPTSAGTSGSLWNDGGTVKVAP